MEVKGEHLANAHRELDRWMGATGQRRRTAHPLPAAGSGGGGSPALQPQGAPTRRRTAAVGAEPAPGSGRKGR
jgi:hypothetical protein